MRLNILNEYNKGITNKYMLMDFPKNEINTLKKQKRIVTTRVSNEFGKYKLDQIIKTPWNDLFRIIIITSFKDIKEHPYYSDPEFTEDMKKQVMKYDEFQVIILEKVSIKTKDLDVSDLYKKIIKIFKWKLNNIYWRYSEYVVDSNGNKYDKIPINKFAGCLVKKRIIYLNTPENMLITMKTWKVHNKYNLRQFYIYIIIHELSHIVWFKLTNDEKLKEYNNIPKDFETEYTKSYSKNNPKYKEELFCEYQAYQFSKNHNI